MQLSPSDLLVIHSTKIHLSDTETERLNDLLLQISDWDAAVLKLIKRGAGPLFYRKLTLLSQASLIPVSAREKLRGSYYKTLARSMMLYEAFGKVAGALTEAGIKVVALKGIYLAEHLYGDIGLRQMSDIDLLIPHQDAEKSLKILYEMGYRSSGDSVSDMIRQQTGLVHYPEMVKDGVSVEIHVNLHWRKKYELITADFIDNAIPAVIQDVSVHTLPPGLLLIYLCVHLDKHYTIGELHHTCIFDIVNFLPSIKSDSDWDEIISYTRVYRCEDVVLRYLLLISKFYVTALPENILESYQHLLTNKAINDFSLYLTEQRGRVSGAKTHFQNIKQQAGFKSKIHYFIAVLFPPREFMLKSYPVKNPSRYMLWYPYRWYVGIKGLVRRRG